MAHFWNHLGKTLLVAAPYIAAPFTGGTSLMLTGAANAAEQRWAQHDAQQAIARGEQPSQFDRWLGVGANVAGVASGIGALGSSMGAGASLANTLGSGASTATRIGNIANLGSNALGTAGQIQGINATNNANNANNKANKGLGPSAGVVNAATGSPASSSGGGITPSAKYTSGIGPSPIMPMGGYSYNDNPMNQTNQSNPNLAQSIFQGRQEAIRNQPFRAGYDVTTGTDSNNVPMTQRMPQIYDSNQGYTPPETMPDVTTKPTANPKKTANTRTPTRGGVGRAGMSV